MQTVKILHTADMHIGAQESFLGTGAEKRRTETALTFEKIVDKAVESKVDFLLIAGDIFDSNRIESVFFDRFFAKIAESSQINVIFSAGNHDPLDSESPFITRQLPQNLFVLGTKDDCITFEEKKVKFYGRSFEGVYLKGEEKFSLATSDDYINICVQHGDLRSDLGSDYNSVTPKFIETCKMDYVALGHIHKRSEIGRIGNTFFAYPGCPEGQGFDETDNKGVLLGEVGKGICNLQFVPISKRQHIVSDVDITGLCGEGEIFEKIMTEISGYGENYADNLYKINLVGEIGNEVNIDTDMLNSRLCEKVYFAKIKDSAEPFADLDALASEHSLKGAFVRRMQEKLNAAKENEKPVLLKALKLGLKAFNTEVKYIED